MGHCRRSFIGKSGEEKEDNVLVEHSSSVEFSTPMGRRITVAAGYKCLWWPYVMTIAFAARHEITRYSVIQSVMVIYHLVDDAISSPPLLSSSLPFPPPVDYRAFIVPFIGRGPRDLSRSGAAIRPGVICYWKMFRARGFRVY